MSLAITSATPRIDSPCERRVELLNGVCARKICKLYCKKQRLHIRLERIVTVLLCAAEMCVKCKEHGGESISTKQHYHRSLNRLPRNCLSMRGNNMICMYVM